MVNDVLQMLGRRATDRVTGFDGVITSVTFDLYGCVQALVTPAVRDGKTGESYWFDVKRLETSDYVMQPPDHASRTFGQEAGPAEKPLPYRI